MSALKRTLESLVESIRTLKAQNKKIRDQQLKDNEKFAKIEDKFDTLHLIIPEFARRIYELEEGGLETVSSSSTKIADLIEYRGYDQDMSSFQNQVFSWIKVSELIPDTKT